VALPAITILLPASLQIRAGFYRALQRFDAAKDASIHNYGLSGAGVFSNSKFYHADGQYDFSKHIKGI
jgi:hypothetical protein